MKKLSTLLSITVCCSSCQSLQRGDLLFHLPETDNHITAVTQGKADHVVIFLGDSVLEAVPGKGVVINTLSSVMLRDEGHYVMGRVRGADIERSIANARQLLGRPYDSIFSNSMEAIYCSELVQQSYVDKQGKQLFAPIAMSFHDSSGHITSYWQEFYDSKGLSVPEGQPGSNPADLMKKVKIKKEKDSYHFL